MTESKTQSFFTFVWYHTSKRLLVALISLTVILVTKLAVPAFDAVYGWLDPIITLLTLGLTSFVWYQQLREEWEEDYLPKLFSGSFLLNGVEIMRFEDAYLTAEGDIRQLAQQIGLQMSDPKARLEFVPTEVKVTGPTLNKEKRSVHYTVTFQLTAPPAGLPPRTLRIWRPPFIKDGKRNFEEVSISA